MKFNSKSFKGSLTAYKSVLVLGLSVLVTACQWGDQVESLVQPNPDDFAVLYSDTSTVQLSTVVTDSVMTGSASRMLVGRYVDPYFGKIQAATYFQPAAQNAVNLAQEAVYDSLVLSMYMDTYSYGDTTKQMNLSVHRLLTDLAEDQTSYFNDDVTSAEAAPVGQVRLQPRPRTKPKLVIRLSDVVGKQLFDKAKNNQLTSATDFVNVLKGLVLKTASTDNGAMLRFRTDSAAVQMHYHVPRIDRIQRDSAIFRTQAIYNHFVDDRTGTVTDNLPVSKRVSHPSSKTGNMAFIQAGPGLMTRIDLPYLRTLRSIRYSAANRAYLRITPKRGTVTNQFKAPPVLHVYRVDKNNEFYLGSTGYPLPLTSLSLTSPIAVTGAYFNDLVTNKQYYYIDISSYVTELLTSDTGDVGSLILRTSLFNENDPNFRSTVYPAVGTDFAQTFDRLIIGDQQSDDPGVKLELYYTTVKVK